ncbi:hypothetical protein ACQX0N_11630 [Clostridium tepidum]
MLELKLKNLIDRHKIAKIEETTEDSRPEGMKELFWQLERDGYCRSYADDRIYYLAYLLAKEKIDIKIEEVED